MGVREDLSALFDILNDVEKVGSQLVTNLAKVEAQISSLQLQLAQVESQLREQRRKREQHERECAIASKALESLDVLVRLLSDKGQQLFRDFLVKGLSLVFPDKRFDFAVEKNTVYVIDGDKKVPFNRVGGGVINVVVFLIIVFFLVLLSPTRFVVLDEAFAQVSAEYIENVSKLVRELASEYNFIFLMVTHRPELAAYATRRYKVEQVNGESILREETSA